MRTTFGLDAITADDFTNRVIVKPIAEIEKWLNGESNLAWSKDEIDYGTDKLAIETASRFSQAISERGWGAYQSDPVTPIKLTGNSMCIDTKRQTFDMQTVENREFMFNPHTGTLILGKQRPKDDIAMRFESEHAQLAPNEPCDDFVSGWVGIGSAYRDGVIHFAPPIQAGYDRTVDKGFLTLKMFAFNGANADTVIRGFPGKWEQSLSKLINSKNFNGKELTTMDENSTLQGNPNSSPPLAQNEYVQELFSILQDNNKDTKGLAALIGHVSEMESFVTRAEQKIADMKSQLSEMKEVQNHPVKTALQNAIKALETKVAEVKERIAELKTNIIEGCKSAVEAFKEKGAAALNNLAKFFHIKGGLKAIDRSAEQTVKQCDKAIAAINEFGQNYHAAGRAVKNMGLIIIGKEPVDAKKENGVIIKVVAAPYRAERAAMNGIKKAADKAIAALEGMEERQAAKKLERQAERADKPDMLAKISKNKERVEREKLELPTPERAKAAGLDV